MTVQLPELPRRELFAQAKTLHVNQGLPITVGGVAQAWHEVLYGSLARYDLATTDCRTATRRHRFAKPLEAWWIHHTPMLPELSTMGALQIMIQQMWIVGASMAEIYMPDNPKEPAYLKLSLSSTTTRRALHRATGQALLELFNTFDGAAEIFREQIAPFLLRGQRVPLTDTPGLMWLLRYGLMRSYDDSAVVSPILADRQAEQLTQAMTSQAVNDVSSGRARL